MSLEGSAPRNEEKEKRILVEAAITGIYLHGVYELTPEKVATLAGLEADLVTTHFDSMETLLLATMRRVSDEFEAALENKVTQSFDNAIGTLQGIIDVCFDSEIAEPKRVSLWYAFMGEGHLRQTYRQLFGEEDDAFFRVVRSLCNRIINAHGAHHLDVDAAARGFTGMIELFWQDILYHGEEFDRNQAKQTCSAYLKNLFPWCYANRHLQMEQSH